MPGLPFPSLRAVAFAAIGLALACRSEPVAPDAATKAAKQNTAAAFVRIPAVANVALSPDGTRLAGISSNEGIRVVFETARTVEKANYLTKIEPGTLVTAFGWSGDRVLVVAFEQADSRGDRERASRRSPDGLVVYDVERSRPRSGRERETRMIGLRIEDWRAGPVGSSWPLLVHPLLPGALIHLSPSDPDHVLINWWDSGEVGASAVRARVRDGFPDVVVPATPGVNLWYADHEGRVRAGSGRSEDGITGIVVGRRTADAPFVELSDESSAGPADFEFAGFGRDPNVLYLYSVGATGRRELLAYDLARNRRTEVLYADKSYDVGALVSSPRDGALWAVEVDAEKPGLHFFDRAAEREQASIDAALPGATNRLVSFDRDAKTALVRSSSDINPPDYYRYDRDRKRMDFLFSANPKLDRSQLVPMKPVRYAARDGLSIPAYLTLPRAGARNVPAIVIVHDGPGERVDWGWDPVVQYLASRGFAVLQPNYRGSTGYGREHERMGYGQWGLAMQNDLDDGVSWLVDEGIANPTRVGIYGVGYGGYAALLAAAKSPNLYRAAASYGGVTDLVDLLEEPGHYRSTDLNQPVEGKLPGDREELAQLSPARLAKRIRIPVFVGHGISDPVVDVAQAHAIVDAIEGAGGSVESHLYRHELHELTDEVNRIEFHEKLAAFFARHLSAIESL